MDRKAAERIGRVDSTFRDANEQILARAKEHVTEEDQLVPFVCECADEICVMLIQLTLGEYEQVRADSRQFMTMMGHERFEGSIEIVLTNHNHHVVRKLGRAGEIADELDFRHRGNGAG